MALIVQKYGGTSVADPDRIKSVADHVAFTRKHGNDVVVVVSAMGKTTDNLLSLANAVSGVHPGREMDMLLTTGERISMALLSMALAGVGVDAVSFTGDQVGIITDDVHTKAKILEVKNDRMKAALAEGKVVVVAGFQGVSTSGEFTTLGRGGSDTTAVALAAALNADVCEIYTDVTGVFTADPRIAPQARKLSHLQFDEMLEQSAERPMVMTIILHPFILGQPHRLRLLRRMTRELSRAEVATWKRVIRVLSHELNNSLAPISSLAHSGAELARRGDGALVTSDIAPKV